MTSQEECIYSSRTIRKKTFMKNIQDREEVRNLTRKIRQILKKNQDEHTETEKIFLQRSPIIANQVRLQLEKKKILQSRLNEVEDLPDKLAEKCKLLADAIVKSQYAVIYTGAGISTSAAIPDYRGPNGVWTLLKKGQSIQSTNFLNAEPTFTHMALKTLYERGYIHHLSSQNCDGLHLRSGFPRKNLSELHGNMFIEVCTNCNPQKEYIRLFDVSIRTSFRRHKTGNFCDHCGEELKDTIVHFGEKGGMESPLNWPLASEAAKECDLIICLGSSLKVLKKYHCLWGMDRPQTQRPKLYIVNLQWTPKDDHATLKINGKCDDVMVQVMSELKLKTPNYCKQNDPIFSLSTALTNCDKTKIQKELKQDIRSICAEFHLIDHDYVKITTKRENENVNLGKISFAKSELFNEYDSVKQEDKISDDENNQSSNPGWFGKGYMKGRYKKKRLK